MCPNRFVPLYKQFNIYKEQGDTAKMVCIMATITAFVSCTNEDFEDSMPVAEMQRSAITRSIGDEITIEEVKARMAELNNRYNVNLLVMR